LDEQGGLDFVLLRPDEVIEEHRADVLHRVMSAVGTFRSLATLDHYSRFRETNRHL
jgi:hypothetical protein